MAELQRVKTDRAGVATDVHGARQGVRRAPEGKFLPQGGGLGLRRRHV